MHHDSAGTEGNNTWRLVTKRVLESSMTQAGDLLTAIVGRGFFAMK